MQLLVGSVHDDLMPIESGRMQWTDNLFQFLTSCSVGGLWDGELGVEKGRRER